MITVHLSSTRLTIGKHVPGSLVTLSPPGLGRFYSTRRQGSTVDGLKSTGVTFSTAQYPGATTGAKIATRPLSRLPTGLLLRNIAIGQLLTSPTLARIGINVLKKLANTKSALLDPDRNPVLGKLIRVSIYDHFCAGTTPTEVQRTIRSVRQLGYGGVILCPAKEVAFDKETLKKGGPSVDIGRGVDEVAMVAAWRDQALRTLTMVAEGDYVGIKLTGAGPTIAQALFKGQQPSPIVAKALESICEEAKNKGSRIWIDAEQQILQPAIDDWTIDLMRRWNRDGHVVVLNTIQSYLKTSRENVAHHLRLASAEGWTPGFKLVRGAYIDSEVREKIHDSKEDTDRSYDGIAHDLLNRSFDGIEGDRFPPCRLFIAGHNVDSIRRASELHRNLTLASRSTIPLEFGQLQGMADEIGCKLLDDCDEAQNCEGMPVEEAALKRQTAPRVLKCLVWGTIGECLGYLGRRGTENQSAVGRLKQGLDMSKVELRFRILGR